MKSVKSNRVWQIIIPLFSYYVLYNSLTELFAFIFEAAMGRLFCLMLSGIITIIPTFAFYRSCPHIIAAKIEGGISEILRYLLYALAVIVLGIALNVLITYTGLAGASKGFDRATKTLQDGELIIKIMCNVIVIPILEELLYRGIILGQLYTFWNLKYAIIISSLLFGMLHFNIVQFLYAFIVGIALGICHIKTKRLWPVIIAHGATNLIVILFS
ncbi:MAG: CPBP family intramembrane metalloprotease [Pseudobutyrivibrio sp.]|nr:CPBP family intramembrane metalloprotease [Pseudobutyrivibrio sp.]